MDGVTRAAANSVDKARYSHDLMVMESHGLKGNFRSLEVTAPQQDVDIVCGADCGPIDAGYPGSDGIVAGHGIGNASFSSAAVASNKVVGTVSTAASLADEYLELITAVGAASLSIEERVANSVGADAGPRDRIRILESQSRAITRMTFNTASIPTQRRHLRSWWL